MQVVNVLKPSFEELKKEISRQGINLSHQRVKILEHLHQNQCHPTADQIYRELKKVIPTLSRSTVYSSLRTLAGAGLVRVLSINDNEVRYDIIVEDHGHFKCEACETIYNFRINVDMLVSEDLASFKIDDKNVYFKGICPRCLSNISITN